MREGAYSASFVGRLTHNSGARVASWCRETGKSKLPPAIKTDYAPLNGRVMVPFLGLVEARFVAHFRRHGLSLQTIRKTAQKLRADFHHPHPMAHRRFRTDGKRIMMEETNDKNERAMIDIMTDEFAFPEVVEASLFEGSEYDDDVTSQIVPMPEVPKVIINPKYALGQPTVSGKFVPTATLHAAFVADPDIQEIADWYGTTPSEVQQAVAFEQRLAA